MTEAAEPNKSEAVTACGGKIAGTDRYPSAIYRGQRVYFCTQACLRVFQTDPDRFMAGEIKHPTEEENHVLRQ
jgi:YHS domain-containing protein